MTIKNASPRFQRDSVKASPRLRTRVGGFLVGLLAAVSSMPISSLEVAQAPLLTGGTVPGNLALVPSVEFPTILSQANIGAYDVTRAYMGYFDAAKCYGYSYSDTESERHFYPVAAATAHACSDNSNWSGNYMNWAATQTIDPFRLALTGGNRVKDTPTETWLQKARYDRDSYNYYPNRDISNGGTASAATPANTNWGGMRVRINNLGYRMYFSRSSVNDATINNPGDITTGVPRVVSYDPAKHNLSGTIRVGTTDVADARVFEVSIRVKVCVAGMLEANCKAYSAGSKPEGLIQEYSDRIRYSIFGFLNDSNGSRDGGVLRANQKYVGPFTHDPATTPSANARAEWNPVTGVLYRNPDSADATQTNADMGISTIADSGVINYLNKFGEMTGKQHKSFDPVSELYYTAVRYIKNQGNVPEYTNVTGNSQEKYELADGFPVITGWTDPIQFRCQANVALGIGDVYTHRDKNLPTQSPNSTDGTNEPGKPALVSADTTVDVVTATQKVAALEGIAINNTQFSGRFNSAYIAGLAYDSHTRDMRPDDATKISTIGSQTLATHWVDVRENQVLEPKDKNQYWLAAKYGGFRVPEGFAPYAATTTTLNQSWWHTNGETLTPNSGSSYLRADNFYVASEADKMVQSLTRAFKKIILDMKGSGGSFAANTTRLETGATTYQAQYFSGSWRGELSAYAVDTATGQLGATPIWQAGDKFPLWSSRTIKVNNAGVMKDFLYANLSAADQTALGSVDVVNYLRGDRSKEEPNGAFRTRSGLLGDIINSQPVYVGKPNDRLYVGSIFTGASAYGTFVSNQAGRTPVIYVGANDGMLHGFNANTGVELFAFVPSTAIKNQLKTYTQPDYDHRYFVDGEITVSDAYYGGGWRTVLVGTLGRGGRGVFALDVTNPAAVTMLWEKSGTDIPALGNNLGKPIIAQVADGDWRVLVGNGPNSASGNAQLVMVKLNDGTVTTIDTAAGSDNGMTAVQAWDSDKNGFTDTVYSGDLKGNLWRLSSITGTPSVLKLFTATDSTGTKAQPITAAPLVGRKPGTAETWVFFGTGRYLNEADVSNKDVQTWYGLIDGGATIAGRSELVQRSIIAEVALTNFDARAITEGTAAELTGKSGWYLDLVSPTKGAEGERMVLPNLFQGFVLIGTTRIPDTADVCRPTGRGFIMAIDPFTGGRLSTGFFDYNGDGKVDSGDTITVGGVAVPASGVGLRDSAPNNPIFIGDVMLISLDDASKKSMKTYSATMAVSRVSWREILGD